MVPRSRPSDHVSPAATRAASQASPLALVPDRIADATLVAAVRAGDRSAFDRLFRAYYAPLCTFVAGYVTSLETAEEIVQDVFLGVWVARATWEVRDGVRVYLYGAARNRALGALRHRRVVERWAARVAQDPTLAATGPGAESADHAIQSQQLAAALARAVTALPERRREAYLLRWRHGLSYVEIARVMGITVKGVDATLNKALQSLRAALEGLV